MISNNAGSGRLRHRHSCCKPGRSGRWSRTYVGENKTFESQFLHGELEVELVPQGTFAEKIRAGGAGIRRFYTPTGYGTQIVRGRPADALRQGRERGEGRRRRTRARFDGRMYVLEESITADFAFVKAFRGRPRRATSSIA